MILALLAVLIIREPPRTRRIGAEHKEEKQPNFRCCICLYVAGYRSVYGTLSLSLGCFAIFSYGANAWFPTYLQRMHGFTAGEAGLFLGSSTLVFGVIGSVTAGWFADRLTQRGRLDGLSVVGLRYAFGFFVCGALGPIIPIPWLSMTLLAMASFFSLTWLGVNTSILQTVTPKHMRAQVSAIHLFITNMIGLGLGPWRLPPPPIIIFRTRSGGRQLLALVGTVSLALGCFILKVSDGQPSPGGHRRVAR